MADALSLSPWDQQPGESAEAYARFLTYRNLGPGRSLALANRVHGTATARKKTQGANGSFTLDSTRHHWKDRADAWDVENLKAQGPELVKMWMSAVLLAVTKATQKLADPSCKPKTFKEALAVLDQLAGYLTPDVIQKLQPAPVPPVTGPGEQRSAPLQLSRASVA